MVHRRVLDYRKYSAERGGDSNKGAKGVNERVSKKAGLPKDVQYKTNSARRLTGEDFQNNISSYQDMLIFNLQKPPVSVIFEPQP
jgi:hypothetical protein